MENCLYCGEPGQIEFVKSSLNPRPDGDKDEYTYRCKACGGEFIKCEKETPWGEVKYSYRQTKPPKGWVPPRQPSPASPADPPQEEGTMGGLERIIFAVFILAGILWMLKKLFAH